MTYQIISDSSCDLEPELAREKNIRVVPFYVSFDGETYRREGVDVPIREFYQNMVDHPTQFPKSSLPSVQDYVDVFTEYARQGMDILCVCITTKFSGSYNAAMNAAEIVKEDYPECRIEVLDSIMNTVLQGILVLELARMRDAGYSLDEVIAGFGRIKESGRIFFTVGNLEYLIQGGRVGKVLTAAVAAIPIRPIITLKEGEIFPSGISRNRKNSLRKVLEVIQKHFEKVSLKPEDFSIVVGYGYNYEEAVVFRDQVKAILEAFGNPGTIPIRQIGATIGVHTGPYPLGIGLVRRYDSFS